MRVEFHRSTDDPEKLVLPGIVYCRKANDVHSVHVIALGWWDYHVSLFWNRRLRKP